ncbi:MAG: UTP--glucose-1-phosphate uridylyltransferase [Oscillospiraceae bacterium]|jgi:UTP--glucose-1-phosphate uridylyltransferase|nr:UTP--glucose-1-phosphate uridylyltransferase [Oscillospiraceae bacterium]
MKVTKAVVLAAGLGTRVLPATKAIPKEMFPIVDKPAIQYVVEELAAAGITDIALIISRGKTAIADHFDRSPDLEAALSAKGQDETLNSVVSISRLANIVCIRQPFPKGTADAVLKAETFVGNEPFAVVYADDIYIGSQSATGELCSAFEERGLGAVAIDEFTADTIHKYSSLAVSPLGQRRYSVTDMVEKPSPSEVLSLFGVAGRCVLPSKAMAMLKDVKPGRNGEAYVTDTMRELARSDGMTGVVCKARRYDMGSPLGVMKATVETALAHEVIGEEFRKWLNTII